MASSGSGSKGKDGDGGKASSRGEQQINWHEAAQKTDENVPF